MDVQHTKWLDKSYSDQSYDLVKYSLLTIIGGSVVVLIVLSALVRDVAFIKRFPKWFAAELVIMGILGAVPLLFVCYSRGSVVSSSLIEFAILVLKFSILHVGLQISGVYTHMFGVTTRHGLFKHL